MVSNKDFVNSRYDQIKLWNEVPHVKHTIASQKDVMYAKCLCMCILFFMKYIAARNARAVFMAKNGEGLIEIDNLVFGRFDTCEMN